MLFSGTVSPNRSHNLALNAAPPLPAECYFGKNSNKHHAGKYRSYLPTTGFGQATLTNPTGYPHLTTYGVNLLRSTVPCQGTPAQALTVLH